MKPVPTVGIWSFTYSGFLRQRRNCTVDISLGVGGSGGPGRGGGGRVVEHLGSARPRFQFLICHSLAAICAGAKHGILPGP